MKEYMKPVLLTSDELAEGVYLASGDGNGCYTTTAYIHQTPQTGRGDYRIQVNAVHNADHTKEAQQLNISFNYLICCCYLALTFLNNLSSLLKGSDEWQSCLILE